MFGFFTQAPTPRRLILAFALYAAALLATALVGQYGFDLHPCHLCLWQRAPYGAIVAIGLVVALLPRHTGLLNSAAWLCVALFAADAGIAFYHTGVELGWIPGPSGCSTPQTGDLTLEEMRAQIMNAPLVSCDQAMIHIFGLSMAAWNALAAMAGFIGGAVLLWMRRASA